LTLLQRTTSERLQAADTYEIERQRLRQPARSGNTNAQTCECARPYANGNALQGVPLKTCLGEQPISERQQARGVPWTLARRRMIMSLQRAAIGQQQSHGGRRRGRIDAEHDHSMTSIRRRSPP
jgi:hypothetical protein